ncbi:MAG: type II toxin-antitoxin system RelB/DinJ family antitoxin [Candidatus Aminicenantes bacterium]|nr:type II toxin-antitoxin system RelB/DinJ family antitoxin [Candidatus Aminicenantes bacterium]
MAKTATIRAAIEPELKKEVESIFKSLGFSATEAINLFYSKVKTAKALPFEIKEPSEETLEAFRDSDEGRNLVKTRNLDDLYNRLEL